MSLLSERPITVRMKREDGVLEVALHTRGGPREHTQYRSAHDCGHQWTADCAFRARPPLRHCFLPRQIHRRWALVARDETLPEIARELVVSRPGARLDHPAPGARIAVSSPATETHLRSPRSATRPRCTQRHVRLLVQGNRRRLRSDRPRQVRRRLVFLDCTHGLLSCVSL